MPYIMKEDREKFEDLIFSVVFDLGIGEKAKPEEAVKLAKLVTSVGEANYVLSSILWRLFDKNPSYTYGNALIACLEDASASLVDRRAWSDMHNDEVYQFVKAFCFGLSGIQGLRGMLACVGYEFYRRRLAEYEDLARKRNGDIL